MALALLAMGAASGNDQPERVNLDAIVRANGGQLVAADNRATLRFPDVVAVVFNGSPEVIVGGADVRLPATVVRSGGVWFAPTQLIQALHLKAPADLELLRQPGSNPSSRPPSLNGMHLTWEEFDLTKGVKALQLFQRPRFDAPDDASLMLLEFAQLGKADPKLEATIKKFLTDFHTDHPGQALYFSVVADRGVSLPESIAFVQNAQQYEVEAQAGLLSLEGQFPNESLGVVLLPRSFDLKKPIRVTWGQTTAEYTFQR
jgi:hypothetical protein